MRGSVCVCVCVSGWAVSVWVGGVGGAPARRALATAGQGRRHALYACTGAACTLATLSALPGLPPRQLRRRRNGGSARPALHPLAHRVHKAVEHGCAAAHRAVKEHLQEWCGEVGGWVVEGCGGLKGVGVWWKVWGGWGRARSWPCRVDC